MESPFARAYRPRYGMVAGQQGRVVLRDFARRSAGLLGQAWATAWRSLLPFRAASQREDAISALKRPKHHQRSVIGGAGSYPVGNEPPLASWSQSFVCAGGSAFLLNVALVLPNGWYISFFALGPFLYRITKARSRECFRLGLLFGLSFFTIPALGSLIADPLASLAKLLPGAALFALFAWSLGWAHQRWGFNPFIIVFLWVSLELGLVKLGFVGGVLGEAGFSHPVFGRLAALFGFVIVSAIIVLSNSLLILAIVKRLKVAGNQHRIVQEDETRLHFFSTRGLFAQIVYLVPEIRGPP